MIKDQKHKDLYFIINIINKYIYIYNIYIIYKIKIDHLDR